MPDYLIKACPKPVYGCVQRLRGLVSEEVKVNAEGHFYKCLNHCLLSASNLPPSSPDVGMKMHSYYFTYKINMQDNVRI